MINFNDHLGAKKKNRILLIVVTYSTICLPYTLAKVLCKPRFEFPRFEIRLIFKTVNLNFDDIFFQDGEQYAILRVLNCIDNIPQKLKVGTLTFNILTNQNNGK